MTITSVSLVSGAIERRGGIFIDGVKLEALLADFVGVACEIIITVDAGDEMLDGLAI